MHRMAHPVAALPQSRVLARIGMQLLQPRQPSGCEPLIEVLCVERAQHIAGGTAGTLEREGKLGLEHYIRPDKDLAQEIGIILEVRRILAGIAGPETHAIERRKIVGRGRTQTIGLKAHGCNVHRDHTAIDVGGRR